MDERKCRKRESHFREMTKEDMGAVGATFLVMLFSILISLPDAVAATYSLPF
jgi:hypothetical protein